MAGATVDQAQQIAAGGTPGTAMVGPNSRVRGQGGLLGTQMDSLTFSAGATGQWLTANTRLRVCGAFAVSATAQGTAVQPAAPSPYTVPVMVTAGNPRIRST